MGNNHNEYSEEDSLFPVDPEPRGIWIYKVKGIAAAFCMVILVCASKVCVQALERSIPDFELNAMRCGFSAVFMGMYFAARRQFPRVAKKDLYSAVLFAILMNIRSLSAYISVTFIPLASTESLVQTTAVVSGIFIYTFINKEKIKWETVIAGPICIAGVFMVLQPPLIFHHNSNSASIPTWETNGTNITLQEYSALQFSFKEAIGYSTSVANGILISLQVCTVKYYSDYFSTHNILICLIWSYGAGVIMSLIPMFIFEIPVFPHGAKNFLLTSFPRCYLCVYYAADALLSPADIWQSRFIHTEHRSLVFSRSSVYILDGHLSRKQKLDRSCWSCTGLIWSHIFVHCRKQLKVWRQRTLNEREV